MKLSVAVILVMLASGRVYAQADARAWTRLVGVSSLEYGYAVAADPFGNALIAGATQGNLTGGNKGRYDFFVSKYDTAGNRLWLTQRGTAERDFAFGAATDASGNVYVTGYTGAALDSQTHVGLWDIFLTKFGPTGTWLWTRQIGTGQDDEGRGVAVDPSGNIYITGYVRGNMHGNTRVGSADFFITKYNTSGTRIWTRLFGSVEVDEAFGIACDASGNVFVTGWCSGSIDGTPYVGNGDNVLAKYSPNGDQLWLRQWGTVNKDTGYGVSTDAAGNVYVSGYTTGSLYGPQEGNRDFFLAKYDGAGNFLWGRQAGTSGHEQGWGVAADAAGNAYIAGEVGGPFDGNTHAGGLDVLLTKYGPTGTRLWAVQMGTADDDPGSGVAVAPNGHVFVSGTTGGNLDGNTNGGLTDAFLIKFTPPPPAPPSVAVANPSTLCGGNSSVLFASPGAGGNGVEWFTGSCGGTLVPGGASPAVQPGVTTTYYARTTNSVDGTVSPTCTSVTVTVRAAVAPDLDRDCDVDQADFTSFFECVTGPGGSIGAGCTTSDFDADNDVDQTDFSRLQRCFSGQGNVAPLNCAQ